MLSISFAKKTEQSHPLPTQIEIDSTPAPLLVLSGAAVTAGVLFLLAVTLGIAIIDSTSDRRFWHAMRAIDKDDKVYAMGQVLSGNAATADVVILGTSAIREGLIPDSEFNALLQQRRPAALTAVNLATSSQSPIETLLLADSIPPRPGQIYLVFMSLSSLRHTQPFDAIEKGEFLRSPEALIQKYSKHGVLPLYWNNIGRRLLFRFRAARQEIYRHLNYRLQYWVQEQLYGQRQPDYDPFQTNGLEPEAPATKEQRTKKYQVDFKQNFAANLDYSTNTLKVLSAHLRTQKCRLIVAAPPEFNGEMRHTFPNEFRLFSERLRELKTSHQFEMLDLNSEVAWNSSDFIDLVHVTESGRAKWSSAKVNWLAQQATRKAF